MDNIKSVAARGFETYLRVNYDPATPEASKKVTDYLQDHFKAYHNVHTYSAALDLPKRIISPDFGNHLRGLLAVSIQDDEDLVGQHSNISSDKSFKELILRKLMIHPAPGMCYAQSCRKVVIDREGRLYSCHRFVGKKEYSIGDVWAGYEGNEINGYLHSPDFNDQRCIHCNLLPICQGRCFENRLKYGVDSQCTAIEDIVGDLVGTYHDEMSRNRV